MKSKKVKGILFKMDIEGRGVVNFDSNDQKYALRKMKGMEHMDKRFDNVMFAKKNFYGSDENVTSRLKISSDCLRNAIFKGDVFAQSPNIQHNPATLCSFIASPAGMLRGYLFADSNTIKRKGAVAMVDAEQTNDAVPYVETFSKSGDKSTEGDSAGNTFFKKETVGNTAYSTMGSIDLKQLQFLSMDSVFDRFGLNPDHFPTFKQFFTMRMPSFSSEPGYYTMDGSVVDIPEYGLKFTNDEVVTLTKEFLSRALGMRIDKSTAFARTSKLEIKLVYDVLEDTFDRNEGWLDLTASSIDGLDFTVADFYIAHDKKEAEALRVSLEDGRKAYAAKHDQKKADKEEKKTADKNLNAMSLEDLKEELTKAQEAEDFKRADRIQKLIAKKKA